MLKAHHFIFLVNEMILEFILKWKFRYELIKNVKVLLIFRSWNDSRFFKQIIVKMCMFDLKILYWNWNGKIFAKSGWIIVSYGFTVPESL